MRAVFALAALLLACGACAPKASAEVADKTGRFGGLTVEYRVITPPGYDSAKAYPAVLVFSGGGQRFEASKRSLATDWEAEAARRGYILVSPGAPEGHLFFEDGDRAFPAFLDDFLESYRVAGKLHIAGHSNGGLSAFHLASRYPQYFSTVTGYPGLLYQTDVGRMNAVKPLCVYMHVGELDPSWWGAMEDQKAQMQKQGFRVAFTVEKGQGHGVHDPEAVNLSKRLFDEIESCKTR